MTEDLQAVSEDFVIAVTPTRFRQRERGAIGLPQADSALNRSFRTHKAAKTVGFFH
jgi:hypothetical protein